MDIVIMHAHKVHTKIILLTNASRVMRLVNFVLGLYQQIVLNALMKHILWKIQAA